MRPLKAIQSFAHWVYGTLGRGGRGLTLMPAYLAGLLWLLSQKFLDLAREAYGQNAALYACLRRLAEAVAEPPLIAYQVSTSGVLGEPLPWQHPLRQLIRQPNELITEYEFWELTTLYLGLAGRAHWWKERDNAGRLIALWPLRPDRVGPIYSTSTQPGVKVVEGWSYLIPGTVDYVPIKRQDVVTFNLPDPAGESGGIAEGIGPAGVLAAEIGADNEATRYVGAMLQNYGTPGVILTTSSSIRTEDEAKLIKQGFIQQFSGSRRGEPAVVDSDTKITTVGFTLKDLEFPAVRQIAEARISAAIGIPAILVGLQTGLMAGIRATISEQREYFAETTCSGYWRRYEAQWTNDIAAEYGTNIVCEFDTSKVKALQQLGRYESDKIAAGFAQGAVTFDEYRTGVLNLPAWGNALGESVLPPNTSTVVPSGELVDDALPNQADDQINTDPRDERPPTVRAARMAAKALVWDQHGRVRPVKAARIRTRRPKATEAHRALARSNRERRSQQAVDHWSGPLADYLRGLGADVAGHLIAEVATKAAPNDDPISADYASRLPAIVRQLHQDAAQAAYQDVGDLLGTALPFDPSSRLIAQALDDGARSSDGILDTTRRMVRAVQAQAEAGGWGPDELADAVRRSGAFSASRAETIARTENGAAYNRLTATAYRASGMVERVEVLDGIGDMACADVNGAVWTLDQAEANPLGHPRCRRAFVGIVSERHAATA